MPVLLLIFIIIPLAEIYVFIQVGSIIGTWSTIGLVVITAVIGTSLLRWQGYGVLERTQATLNKGDFPVDSVIDGVFLLVAGALLLTPGLITDAIGFLLFIPFVRRTVATYLFKRFVAKGNVRATVYSDSNFYEQSARNDRAKYEDIIDVEFSEVEKKSAQDQEKEDKPSEPNPNSPWKNNP